MIDLRSAFVENERTRKILDGTVADERVALHPIALTPGEMFLRQLKHAEFDVSELSLSSLMIASLRGPSVWQALPVFTTREFFHTGILVREDSSLTRPDELYGRRVGVLEYQQTAVVWIRGALQHEFGVRDVDLEWFMERQPATSHGSATGFAPPAGMRLTYVPPDSSLAALLMDGAIDAILFYPPEVDVIDRRSDGGRERLRARTLFADPAAEARRYFAKTGISPVNHGVVVRRSLAERWPWLPRAVFDACAAANGDPAFPYGFAANRKTLEALTSYLYEQRLIPRRVDLADILAPATLAT